MTKWTVRSRAVQPVHSGHVNLQNMAQSHVNDTANQWQSQDWELWCHSCHAGFLSCTWTFLFQNTQNHACPSMKGHFFYIWSNFCGEITSKDQRTRLDLLSPWISTDPPWPSWLDLSLSVSLFVFSGLMATFRSPSWLRSRKLWVWILALNSFVSWIESGQVI